MAAWDEIKAATPVLRMGGKENTWIFAQHPPCTAPAWQRESGTPRHLAHGDGRHVAALDCIGATQKNGQIERKRGEYFKRMYLNGQS